MKGVPTHAAPQIPLSGSEQQNPLAQLSKEQNLKLKISHSVSQLQTF